MAGESRRRAAAVVVTAAGFAGWVALRAAEEVIMRRAARRLVRFRLDHDRCAGVRAVDRGELYGYWCPVHEDGLAFDGRTVGRLRRVPVSCSHDGCEPASPCPACAVLGGTIGG